MTINLWDGKFYKFTYTLYIQYNLEYELSIQTFHNWM